MFRGMEYVYEVYKEQSFSKAASNLYISQPALSATIKKIENRIGMPLFDRSTTPIRLTECGRKYIESVKDIMYIQDNFSNYINDLKNLTGGTLSIGATNFFASILLPPIIIRFSKTYPNVSINLVEGNSADLEHQLFSGELDLIIEANDFDPRIYDRQKLCHEHIVLAAPASFASCRAAKEYQITTEDILNRKHLKKETKAVPFHYFDNDPFIQLREGNDTRIRGDRICHAEHFKPNITLTLDQQMTAFNLVCRGMGISFISDSLIKQMPQSDAVCYFKLENGDSHRDIYFYHKKNKYVTPAMHEFLKAAEEF